MSGRLSAAASTAVMRGSFVVTMTATGGAATGRSVTGTLALEPQDSALIAVAGAQQPLRGTAEIALDSVGAVRMGDLASEDPAAPGVAVYEQRGAGGGGPTVVVRLGSASNGRGAQPFDAGHTTLYVFRITAGAFAGGWSSSAGPAFPPRTARGYFCAVRTGP